MKSRISHWAMRKFSTRCQKVVGTFDGRVLISSRGKSATALSKVRWLSRPSAPRQGERKQERKEFRRRLLKLVTNVTGKEPPDQILCKWLLRLNSMFGLCEENMFQPNNLCSIEKEVVNRTLYVKGAGGDWPWKRVVVT